jgi:hypothetical protein
MSYCIRRTNKKDPSDTVLIKGWPGPIGDDYPNDIIFETHSLEFAKRYQREMQSSRHGETELYTIEEA